MPFKFVRFSNTEMLPKYLTRGEECTVDCLSANDGSRTGKVEPPPSHRNGVRRRRRRWFAYFLQSSPEISGLVDKLYSSWSRHGNPSEYGILTSLSLKESTETDEIYFTLDLVSRGNPPVPTCKVSSVTNRISPPCFISS